MLKGFVLTAVLATIAACLALASPSPAEEILTAPGPAVRVIDGDTVEIAGQRLQIYGIDAPELGQVCLKRGNFLTVLFGQFFCFFQTDRGRIHCQYIKTPARQEQGIAPFSFRQ